MPTGWVKSLQCKSRAADDVIHHHLLPSSTSCRFQSLMDVVETSKKKPKPKSKQPFRPPPRKPEPRSEIQPGISTRHPRAAEFCSPALTELPEGHPSRNVIEIIFHTSWSVKPFPGRVDLVFKVQNKTRTVTRFEEYRELVKSSANLKIADVEGACDDHTRCLADGNEVMRFYCLGPAARGSEYVPGSGTWGFHGGKGASICTFSGSGVAHENAGSGRGRRAMLVCRVIAGRVYKRVRLELEDRVGFNSVSGENGELLVFDTRAVLPCFLIIYKV